MAAISEISNCLEVSRALPELEKIIHIWEPHDCRPSRGINIIARASEGPQLVSDSKNLPYLVAHVLTGGGVYSIENEANAVLIARAPALYVLLRYLVTADDTQTYSDTDIVTLTDIAERILVEIDLGRINSELATEIRFIDRKAKDKFFIPNRNEFGQYTSLVSAEEGDRKITANKLLNTWGAFLATKAFSLHGEKDTSGTEDYYCIFALEPNDRKMVPMPIIAIAPAETGRKSEANALLISRAPILHLLVANIVSHLKRGENPAKNYVLWKTAKFVLEELEKGEVNPGKSEICWD